MRLTRARNIITLDMDIVRIWKAHGWSVRLIKPKAKNSWIIEADRIENV